MTAPAVGTPRQPAWPAPLRSWRKYVLLANLALQVQLAYRGAYLLRILTEFVQIGVLYFVWGALYAGRTEVAGYQWGDIRTYLLVTFVVNLLMSYSPEREIGYAVRQGVITKELIRPLDFQWARLAEALGVGALDFLVYGLGAGAFAFFLLRAALPTPEALVLFVPALLGGFVVKFLLSYCTGICSFWTTSILGLVWAQETVRAFLSGGLVPLAFLPDQLETVALYLPFQAVVHTPALIFLGRLTGLEALGALAVQACWIVVLWYAGRALFARASKKITIHGG